MGRDRFCCLRRMITQVERSPVMKHITVEPCPGLRNEIGVPRKEWRHVHDG